MIRAEARRRIHERALAAQREDAVRTDPAARAAWLDRFEEPWREAMAVYADRVYGVLPEVQA